MSGDAKILFLDIECSMALGYFYGLYDQNISIQNIVEHPRMIAFSAKWYGRKKTLFYSEYHHSRKEMLEEMHALLDEADVVVGWNSKTFDIKWINSEFMVEGMKPPAPYKQIDLMREVKRNSRFISHKLDYVSERLLDENKIEYSMAKMWVTVNDSRTDEATRKKEWNSMKRYAIKDTVLLEPLFDELKPWIKMPHPVSSKDGIVCRNCGGEDLQRRGYTLTLQGKYPRYSCKSCGAWSRGTTRTPVGETRSIS